MASSKPTLLYWDLRGRGEPIRYLLQYVGVDYEDKRLSFADGNSLYEIAEPWFQQKGSLGMDLPNLPCYMEGDIKITQSVAILQHLGRKHNLYGDTLKDKATIDMVAQTAVDLCTSVLFVYNFPRFNEIKEDWKKSLPEKLSPMNRFLEGKDFVIGPKISWVDFLLYESVEWYRQCVPDVFENSPELQNLNRYQKRIEAIPQIKVYMASDKFKDWPFMGPYTHWGSSKVRDDPDFKPFSISYRTMLANFPLDD